MKNKNVGFLIVGISVIIGILVFSFNTALKNIIGNTCTHGPACSMYETLSIQTWISIGVISLVFLIGIFLIFSKESERVIVKKVKPYTELELKPKKFKKESLKNLDKDEAKIMNLLLENKGNMFQSRIVEKTGFNKVRITRILDSLEAQGFIERKRRGMTNIVVLKN